MPARAIQLEKESVFELENEKDTDADRTIQRFDITETEEPHDM